MKVCIVGPNLLDQSKGSFHVHEASCADLRKSQYRYHRADLERVLEMASQAEVIEDTYCDIIAEDPSNTVEDLASDFYFYPCTAGLPFREGA